jgi:hypothetical protein
MDDFEELLRRLSDIGDLRDSTFSQLGQIGDAHSQSIQVAMGTLHDISLDIRQASEVAGQLYSLKEQASQMIEMQNQYINTVMSSLGNLQENYQNALGTLSSFSSVTESFTESIRHAHIALTPSNSLLNAYEHLNISSALSTGIADTLYSSLSAGMPSPLNELSATSITSFTSAITHIQGSLDVGATDYLNHDAFSGLIFPKHEADDDVWEDESLEPKHDLVVATSDDLQNLYSSIHYEIQRRPGQDIYIIVKESAQHNYNPQGEQLYQELQLVQPGKGDWSKYEQVGERIVRYLFAPHLKRFQPQSKTDDELHRRDLICQIALQKGFWQVLTQEFHTLFPVFEFKNYTRPIKPREIETTERYLLKSARRMTAIILSRKGAGDNALQATRGALREQDKLILVLDDGHVEQMLIERDQGGDPAEIMFGIFADLSMTLSR